MEQLLLRDELVEQLRLGRQGPQPAADDHAEAAFVVADHRAQGHVVDGGLHAILIGTAIEGELEFAR